MADFTTQQRRRRVLVIAYVFPPSGGAGVQRVTKFVKYLPEFGWDCSVLTVSNPSVPLQDPTLLSEVPATTIVRRARTYEPGYALKNVVSASAGGSASKRSGVKRLLKGLVRAAGNAVLQPDAQVLWYPQAVREGMRLLAEQPHDAIFVTAPPFSSLLIGAEMSRRSGLPLVLDYRDEWGISNRYQENRQKSNVSQWLQRRMQNKVLRQASSVVATTRRSADSLKELITAAQGRASVTQIYNGFDANDIPVSRQPSLAGPDRRDGRFRIAYVGTLWNLTSIEPLVMAMQYVCATEPETGAKLELVVAGRRTNEQDAILDRLNGLPCRVVRENYLEHGRAIELMQSADAQCLLLSDVEEASRVMPAKTFEYLALGRPILSIAPHGEVSELLNGCPCAYQFLPTDLQGISDYLIRGALDLLPETLPGTVTGWDVNRFERRELTRQLAGVFNGLVPGGPAAVAVPRSVKQQLPESVAVGS